MKKLIVIVFALSMMGCSTKFAYKNIDWLVYWYLDDYVELNNTQEQEFDRLMANWLKWHQQQELPQYLSQLQDISNDVLANNVSLAMIETHRERAQAHWHRLRNRIVPDIIPLAASLDSEQVTYLFAALHKENQKEQEEIDEQLQKSEKSKQDKRLQRAVKSAKRWLGRLNPEQENLLENTIPKFHRNGQLWLDYRVRYQNELRKVFVSAERDTQFSEKLQALLTEPEQFRSAELVQRNNENANTYMQFLLSLAIVSDEKHRTHLVEELGEFENDLIELINR